MSVNIERYTVSCIKHDACFKVTIQNLPKKLKKVIAVQRFICS